MHSGKPLHRTCSSFLYSHNLSQVEKWHALAEIRSLSPQVSSRMLLNLTLLLLRNCNCTNWCKLQAQPLALKDQQWYLDCFLSVQCWLWRCPATQQALRKNMEKLWTTTHNYGKNAQLLKEFFRQFLLALILRAREAIWIIGHPRCLFCRSFSLSLSLPCACGTGRSLFRYQRLSNHVNYQCYTRMLSAISIVHCYCIIPAIWPQIPAHIIK